MTRDSDSAEISRRKWLKWAGASSVSGFVALAGCSGGGNTTTGGGGGTTSSSGATTSENPTTSSAMTSGGMSESTTGSGMNESTTTSGGMNESTTGGGMNESTTGGGMNGSATTSGGMNESTTSGGMNESTTSGGMNGSANNSANAVGSTATISDQTLEVLHGWTGGDGQKAVNNLIKGFHKAFPNLDPDFKAIGGGGNTNLDTTISKRAQNKNLPSSWDDWPGANLTQFTSADLLEDISDSVWAKNGMEDAYVEDAKRLSKVKGTSVGKGPYVCVPIGSHRLNDLFYNVHVVKDAGVDPESIKTPKDLTDAMKTVEKNTDAVGMAQGQKAPFTTLQLWVAVFLGQAGYDAYMKLIDGKGDKKKVKAAFETLKSYTEYWNSDSSTIGFTTANQKIINGTAAFMHNGNWVAGAYRNKKGFDYGDDWDNITFPGTEGMYTLHFDAFPAPTDGPAPEKTIKWLQYVGSTDAQVRFNQYKGSIPPRTDAPTDAFGPYLTSTIKDFKNAKKRPPTMAHGLAVPPNTLSDVKQTINDNFVGSYNVDAATSSIMSDLKNQK